MIPYKIIGRGRPVILVHGFGISYPIWRKLIPRIKGNKKIILVELFCESKTNYFDQCVRELESLRKKLKIKKWIMVGYSIGSRIVERYSQIYPGHIDKIIYPFPLVVKKTRKMLLDIGLVTDKINPGFTDWILRDWRLRILIKHLGFNDREMKLVNLWYKEISKRPTSFLKKMVKDLPERVSQPFITKVPSYFIWGMKDRVIGAHNHIYIGSDHSGIETKSNRIATIINDIIN